MKRILLAAAVMLIASCSKNSNTGDEPSPVKPTQIPINVSMGVWTRATDTAYESGDKVGIYPTLFIVDSFQVIKTDMGTI